MGQLLRSEIFTEDDSPLKDNPYVVTEARFQVKQLQPIEMNGKSNKHAVYISLPLEKVTANYDRNPKDPRLAHEMTLEIDDFGNVLKSASVAYPRLYGMETDPNHCSEQYELKIVYTENEVFNQADAHTDWYVKGIPLSSKVYEIESLIQTQTYPPFFKREDLVRDIPTATKKLLSAQVNYFRGDDDDQADNLSPTRLAFGEVQSLLLPYGTYQLIFIVDILQNAYGDLTDNWQQKIIDEGYLNETHPTSLRESKDIAGWWVTGGFTQYDPDNFYSTTKIKDIWGNMTEVEFDTIGLLPIRIKDPLKNEIKAVYDYRILQPLEITDPNGNKQQVAYDGFGRVIRTAIVGKNGEGDLLNRNNARNVFAENDTETSVVEYHHREFYDNGKPNFVHTYTRETHYKDLDIGKESRWMEARVYSDGFGQELQTKAKVAPGIAFYVENGIRKSKDTRLETDPNPEIEKEKKKRWLGTGRTIYDNKGQAVKQYEPYFSTTKDYENEEELVMWGVSPFIHYDAVGRVYRTDMPDGTYTKVEFTPWMSKTYDANDTTELDGEKSDWYNRMNNGTVAEKRAAALSLEHKNFPSIFIMDSLGRTVKTIQEFKSNSPNSANNQMIFGKQTNESKVVLDTIGNPLKTIDANTNIALETVFDLVGRPLKSISNDAGTSHIIYTIDNQPLFSWLPRGQRLKMVYDKFRRPKELWVKENGIETIKEATIYGEKHPNPDTKNMRGQVWKNFDAGGFAEVSEYDFKGAPLMSTRHLFKDYTEVWTASKIANHSATSFEIFESSIQYDALGRPTKSIAPDGSLTINEYDEGGALYTVKSKISGQTETTQVKKIEYNEKGQRQKIVYGNNVQTTYTYDPLSYRLTNLKTQANAHLGGKIIQDLIYTYDAVGNIVEIKNEAEEDVFFKNQRVEAKQQFVYDSLNRLIEAKGREHIGQQQKGEQLKKPKAESGQNTSPYYNNFGSKSPAPADKKALRAYIQQYAYDKVGNILRWKHIAHGTDNYTRDYTYQNDNNRLISTQRGSANTIPYTYDQAGNIEQLSNHVSPIEWNFENQPTKMFFAQNNEAHYHYDAGGERLRKVVINDNVRKERIYLGNYEIYRETNHTTNIIEKERKTLHIADDSGRICIIETLVKENTQAVSKLEPIYRFQLSNHLGSVGIELDKDGAIISYEEYHPYGTTSFYWKNTDISQKTYSYTGKERDAESGLSYHSARYYMPWLGRWLSADPAGIVDGACLYQYGLSNPVMLRDEDGMQSENKFPINPKEQDIFTFNNNKYVFLNGEWTGTTTDYKVIEFVSTGSFPLIDGVSRPWSTKALKDALEEGKEVIGYIADFKDVVDKTVEYKKTIKTLVLNTTRIIAGTTGKQNVAKIFSKVEGKLNKIDPKIEGKSTKFDKGLKIFGNVLDAAVIGIDIIDLGSAIYDTSRNALYDQATTNLVKDGVMIAAARKYPTTGLFMMFYDVGVYQNKQPRNLKKIISEQTVLMENFIVEGGSKINAKYKKMEKYMNELKDSYFNATGKNLQYNSKTKKFIYSNPAPVMKMNDGSIIKIYPPAQIKQNYYR